MNVNNMTTEIIPVENKSDIARLSQAGTAATEFYCSIADDGSRESAVARYNAINNAQHKLDDCKGEVLEITDVVAHPVSFLADGEDGEIIDALRIVLVDKDGVGYETVANGVLSSLEKIFNIVGKPSYNPPLKMVAREQKTRKGFKTLTIDLA